MIDRQIPPLASLEQLRKQAKDLLKAQRANSPSAQIRIEAFHPSPPVVGGQFALHDAQLVVAREFGFTSWPKLVEAFEPGRRETKGRPKEGGESLHDLVDACVWHRPEKHQLAKELVAGGADCDIWIAARGGLLEKVRALATAAPELIRARDRKGRTPLYRSACVYGRFDEGEVVADWLIARGAEVDIFTASTFCLLEHARRILERDPAAARSVDPDGMTALHWVVRPRRNGSDAAPLTKLLLQNGADVHARNRQEEGMQPLHHAAEWPGRAAQLDLLLEYGADLESKSDTGMTPLDYAKDRQRKGAVRNLVDRGAVVRPV